jgi:serralysin
VTLTLSAANNADLGTSNNPATLTIVDDDGPTMPTVDFDRASYSVDEDDGPATITVTLSAAYTSVVTVDYASANDTAIAPADYMSTSGTLTFTVGATSRAFDVPIVDDSEREDNEDLTLTLSKASNAILGTTNNPATLTIEDNDMEPIYLPLILRGS